MLQHRVEADTWLILSGFKQDWIFSVLQVTAQ